MIVLVLGDRADRKMGKWENDHTHILLTILQPAKIYSHSLRYWPAVLFRNDRPNERSNGRSILPGPKTEHGFGTSFETTNRGSGPRVPYNAIFEGPR